MKYKIPLKPLTSSQKLKYENAIVCHICEKTFSTENFRRVIGHSPEDGFFRGPAHSICNLHFQAPKYISIIMHGLKNYGSRLFLIS